MIEALEKLPTESLLRLLKAMVILARESSEEPEENLD